MSEEKIDGLEGLDDFGDDFGEQLDSFMESDGEDEGDSELDSFFEDLSTIDDLESDDISESSITKNVGNDDDQKHNEEDVQENDNLDDDGHNDFQENDDLEEEDHSDVLAEEGIHNYDEKQNGNSKKKYSKREFPLKAVIIASVFGLILGAITIAILYYLSIPNETKLHKTEIESPPKPVPIVKLKKSKLKKPKLKPKKREYRHFVQVISCISKECVDDSRLQLRNLGYKTRVRTSSEISVIAEVISNTVLGEEESAIIVKKINSDKSLAGYAFRKSLKKGFLLSMGLFPELETANRVRTYLNQAFREHIFFKIQPTTQKIFFKKVQIVDLKTKTEAEILTNRLKRKNPDFKEAFVFSVKK